MASNKLSVRLKIPLLKRSMQMQMTEQDFFCRPCWQGNSGTSYGSRCYDGSRKNCAGIESKLGKLGHFIETNSSS